MRFQSSPERQQAIGNRSESDSGTEGTGAGRMSFSSPATPRLLSIDGRSVEYLGSSLKVLDVDLRGPPVTLAVHKGGKVLALQSVT